MRSTMAATKNNKGWQIRPDRDLLKRLNQLTVRFRRETPNKLAVEILTDCVDIWEEAAQAFEDTIRRRAQEGQAIKNAMLGRMINADTEREIQPNAQGKKGRK